MNFFNPYFAVTEASGHGMKDVLDWYNATDSGSLYNGVHVVFVDFRKAFDLVDHGVLLTNGHGHHHELLEMDTELPIRKNAAG